MDVNSIEVIRCSSLYMRFAAIVAALQAEIPICCYSPPVRHGCNWRMADFGFVGVGIVAVTDLHVVIGLVHALWILASWYVFGPIYAHVPPCCIRGCILEHVWMAAFSI